MGTMGVDTGRCHNMRTHSSQSLYTVFTLGPQRKPASVAIGTVYNAGMSQLAGT